jgi:hypothetical protein
MTKEHTATTAEDLTNTLKVAVGATIGALALSVSTHHLVAPEFSKTHTVTAEDLSHQMEREREVLHAHASYGRTRYAMIAGGAE